MLSGGIHPVCGNKTEKHMLPSIRPCIRGHYIINKLYGKSMKLVAQNIHEVLRFH